MTTKTADALTVDLENLTLDEVDLLEVLLDAPMDSLSKPGARRAPMLRALAVVTKHREDPEGWPVETAEERAASLKKAGGLKLNLSDGAASNPPAPAAS